jgi:putative DNA primase/helicase
MDTLSHETAQKSKVKAAIKAEDFQAEIQNLASQPAHGQTLGAAFPHSDIFDVILETLEPINFREIAETQDLPQKHLLVICIKELLARVKQQNFGLARKDDFIYAYNGEFWKELDREMIKNFLGHVAERLGINSLEAQSYDFKNKLYLQFLSSAYFEPINQTDAVLLNTQNGTVEITKDSQTLREFRREDFLTYQLPFEYDETAAALMFKKYLDRVLPEKELQNITAEFFGYVFTKHLKMEKAMLLYGDGANGKSVIFDVMNALLVEENIQNFSLSDLMAEHNRALIANKLLNFGSEINAGITRDIFKNLVSGEPIQARLKYGNSFTMRNYAKLAFNCNTLPKDFDHQHAYFRRLLIIPFQVKIPENEEDKTLAQKIIKTELAGVFNWLIEGLKRLLETEKFTESDIVKETLDIYKKESDSVAMFIEEKDFKPSPAKYELLNNLYADYRAFCMDEGSKSLKRSNFKERLEKLGFQISPKMNNGVRVYLEQRLETERDENLPY